MSTNSPTIESTRATFSPAFKFAVSVTLFLSYAFFAFAWRAGDAYVASLDFGGSERAFLTNALTIAQALGSLVAANVLLRMGARNAFALSSLLIIFGGAISFTTAFPLVFFIRFVLGIGGALTVVFMSGIVASLLTGRALQIANGVNSVAFNTGMALALTVIPLVSGDPGVLATISAGISLLILVLWLVLSRRVPKNAGGQAANEETYTMADGFKDWFNWIFALAYTGLLAYYIVAFTFMDPETIRWVIYAGVIGALTGTVVAARVPDKLKPTIVVVAAAAQLVTAAAMLALSDHRYAALVGVLLGLVIFFPMPFFVQLAFMRVGVTPRQVSVTFSIFWAVSYAGSAVIIQIFGWMVDLTGGFLPGSSQPVSITPLAFIVAVESTFLIGSILLARHLRRASAEPTGIGA